MKIMVFLGSLLMLVVTSNVQAGAFEDGLSMYGAGNFLQAEKIWLPAAQSGDSSAQYYLGQMYYKGKPGVRKDLSKAWAWLSLSSKGGMELAAELLDDLNEEMNDAEMAKAQQMVGSLGN